VVKICRGTGAPPSPSAPASLVFSAMLNRLSLRWELRITSILRGIPLNILIFLVQDWLAFAKILKSSGKIQTKNPKTHKKKKITK
jgi:hypothetical protein